MNITNRCTNNCQFCMRNFMNGVGGFNLKLRRDPRAREIISELQEVMNRKNWKEIVFCGFGEPTARLDCLLEVAWWITKYYGKLVSVRIDTNGHGYLLKRGWNVIKELKAAGVDKIGVSLNAYNKETYRQVCRPVLNDAYESVQIFIKHAKEDFDTEVTAVAIPEVEVQRVGKIAQELGAKFRIREHVPCSF